MRNDAHTHLFIFVFAMCVFGSGECFSDVVAEVNQGVESFQEDVVRFCCFPILGCVCVQLRKNSMRGAKGDIRYICILMFILSSEGWGIE